MTIRICVSVVPKTVVEALDLIEKAEKERADFIEVRLDYLSKYEELGDIARYSNTPLIATCRSTRCNGKSLTSTARCLRDMLSIAESGFEYVDMELSTLLPKNIAVDLVKIGIKSIVSFHDFTGTPRPDQLRNILRQEIDSGADICKIVTTAKMVEDNLTVLDFVHRMRKSAEVVCFAMGELGKLSRLLSPVFGGFLTIASLEGEKETAPGQLTIQEMRKAYQALGLM